VAKKKKIVRFLKTCVLVVAGITGFVLLLVLALWLFFPEKQVLDLVARQSAASGWPVKIQTAAWRPPGKIELQGIEVSFQPDSASESIPFFELKRAAIRCRILPLLRRELSVSEVVLDQPSVHLSVDFIKKVKAWAARQPVQKTGPKPLPVELGIESLTLRNFQLKTILAEPSPIREIGIEGLNLDVSKLQIPSQLLKSPEGFRGLIRLYSEKGSLSLSLPQGGFCFDPNLEVRLDCGKKGQWTAQAKTDFRPKENPNVSIAAMRLEAEGSGLAGKIRLKESEVKIGGETAALIEGESDLSDKLPQFQIKITEHALPLETIKTTLMHVLPDTFRQILKPINIHGQCNLVSGWISGNPGQYRFKLSSNLHDGSMEVPFPRVLLEHGDAGLTVEGTGSTAGIQKMHVTGHLTIPLVRSQFNDTIFIDVNRTSLSWIFDLNNAMVPVSGIITGSIQNLLGGQCAMNANWQMKAQHPSKIDTIAISSEIRVTSVDFSTLPNLPSGIKGKGNVNANLKVHGEKDIVITVTAEVPEVKYPYMGKMETLTSLHAGASMAWRSENSFRKWILDRTDLRVMDLFSADLRGEAVPEERKFVFTLKEGTIRNASLTQYLPQQLRNEIEGVELSGREILELTVRSSAGRGTAGAFSLSGKLRFEDGGISLPLQAVRMEGIQGDVDLQGTQRELSGKGLIQLGKIFLQRMRPEPVTGSEAGFTWHFIQPDRLEIREGRLAIPDLASECRFSAGVDHLSSHPILKGRADFSFESADSLRLTPLLVLLGKAGGWATLESSESGGSQVLRLQGEVSADSLNVIGKPMVEVADLHGRIPFTLDIDPVKQGFATPAKVATFPEFTYERDRSVFKGLFPNLSDVHIRSVSVAGYPVEDIQMDVEVRDGMVQVPRFQAKLLGGNLDGSLRLELKDGKPASMAYFVRADAARINSAVLLKSQLPDEETELDATMSFRGRGLDPTAGLDVEGALHITKIGPKFAGTLLRGIDPQGMDRSIRLTRRLFDLWYKPKLFSFELRHGYVYPSLILSQPWFSPLRIPEKVEYGRLPIEFFLKNPISLAKK
jgi:hypothetical protein